MIAILIIGSILLSILIFWGIDEFNHKRKQKKEFQLFEQQLQPGVILIREYKPENPFLKTTQTKYKVLNIKDGWCEYVLLCLFNIKIYTESVRYDTIKNLYEQGFKIEYDD